MRKQVASRRYEIAIIQVDTVSTLTRVWGRLRTEEEMAAFRDALQKSSGGYLSVEALSKDMPPQCGYTDQEVESKEETIVYHQQFDASLATVIPKIILNINDEALEATA